ncbi:hypothetical protein HBI70_195070 [Parastagonospora nodorum]|nr:hypothetical protein HBI09_133670 [Parastagonospora nodorum]KAH4198188.1 hypothetical protein HBI95_185610 [Parastagonospora nodorum]KAH4423405.1 hypothetical protein HBH93_194780 [Parastagonospora nodorum]KAH4483275.1 hypothetical protein HBH89_233980 [Parastagonospora nodorum]KAH5001297.1 hypothetical protein HBI77_146730 [Parastagonospora nodorum]
MEIVIVMETIRRGIKGCQFGHQSEPKHRVAKRCRRGEGRDSGSTSLVTVLERFVWRKGQTGTAFVAPAPCPAKQPVRDADDLCRLLPVASLVCVFNGVVDDAPFLVELEHEEASEFLLGTS